MGPVVSAGKGSVGGCVGGTQVNVGVGVKGIGVGVDVGVGVNVGVCVCVCVCVAVGGEYGGSQWSPYGLCPVPAPR